MKTPFPVEDNYVPHVPNIDYGVLDELMGYAVRRAQLTMNNKFLRALASWNITPQRFSALVIIDRNPGLKLTRLAQILSIARSGAVILVDALTDMDYVDRVPSEQDRRAYGLVLTPKGHKDLPKIVQAVQEHDRHAASMVGARDRQTLMRLLDLLATP